MMKARFGDAGAFQKITARLAALCCDSRRHSLSFPRSDPMNRRNLSPVRGALCALVVTLPCAVFAMANPASVFCSKMGGRSEIAKLSDGSEIGLCFLGDNRIIEEWTFFRMHHGHAPSGAGATPGAAASGAR
ncbi:DUF333 domain-containing protein [Paracidovorax wautersii]|uniref:DUF333 domain-containing protein n=1 Tax=Paracidovorax wautersii TaxID=1177982 RepID=UPI0031CEFD65